MKEIKDRAVVVVSGAANGIGAAIFLELLSRKLLINGREKKVLPIGIDMVPLEESELSRKLQKKSFFRKKGFDFFQGDASDFRAMEKVFKDINRIDGLVNNAGLLGGDNSHGGRHIKSLRKMIKSHVETTLVLTELSVPKMTQGGSIVNIGSIETLMAAPDVVLYTTAKSAVWGLTESYAITLAPLIRVNMISPGNVNTERNIAQYKDNKDLLFSFEGKTPLKRSVEPVEIAREVLFLLSSDSSATTGQNRIVDCGYTIASWDPLWTRTPLKDIYK